MADTKQVREAGRDQLPEPFTWRGLEFRWTEYQSQRGGIYQSSLSGIIFNVRPYDVDWIATTNGTMPEFRVSGNTPQQALDGLLAVALDRLRTHQEILRSLP